MPEVSPGMHKVPHSPDMRARRNAKNIRNRGRRTGIDLVNETTHHNSCNSYGCKHKRHSVPSGHGHR